MKSSRAGIAITRKNDKNKKEATVSITLDKGQKAEFLEKAEKYLVSQMKDFLKNEGNDLHEVKKAVEEYEKNPNAETAAKVAEAYEKTAIAIGAGFTPIAGDVIDGFIALKDVYRGDYLSAGISTAAMFTPFLPATVAKKISKAIFETPLGKKIADSSFGKWAIARFGKKADDVGEKVPAQLIRGQKFEKVVLYEQGLEGTKTKIGNRIVDSFKDGLLTEVKDVNYLYRSGQLKTFLETGKPVNLIVSPNTKISQPLIDAIRGSKGNILVRVGENNYVPYKK